MSVHGAVSRLQRVEYAPTNMKLRSPLPERIAEQMTEDVIWTRLSKYLLHFEAPAQNQFATLKLDHFVLRRRLRD